MDQKNGPFNANFISRHEQKAETKILKNEFLLKNERRMKNRNTKRRFYLYIYIEKIFHKS